MIFGKVRAQEIMHNKVLNLPILTRSLYCRHTTLRSAKSHILIDKRYSCGLLNYVG